MTPVMRTATPITTITMGIAATIMLMTTTIEPAGAGRKDRARPTVAADAEPAPDGLAALYRLMTWLSPSFPVGAFSYSSGLEWAVESGDIVNVVTLQDWLASMLADGPGY